MNGEELYIRANIKRIKNVQDIVYSPRGPVQDLCTDKRHKTVSDNIANPVDWKTQGHMMD